MILALTLSMKVCLVMIGPPAVLLLALTVMICQDARHKRFLEAKAKADREALPQREPICSHGRPMHEECPDCLKWITELHRRGRVGVQRSSPSA